MRCLICNSDKNVRFNRITNEDLCSECRSVIEDTVRDDWLIHDTKEMKIGEDTHDEIKDD